MFLYPLGSPMDPQKRSYVHVPRVTSRTRQCVRHRSVRLGPVPGWVYWVGIPGGNTGVLPSHPATALSPPARQRPHGSGPSLQGRVVWKQGGRPLRVTVRWCARSPVPTLRARSVPLQGPSLVQDCSPGKRARLRTYFLKVSQNPEVSPKSM